MVSQSSMCRLLTRTNDRFSALVVMFRDKEDAIERASIVVTDGPYGVGLGGTRNVTWESDAAMLEDNIRLSRGMQRKSQFHELPFDGGKVCVQVVSGGDKNRAFRRVASEVRALAGRCITTEDMGTTPELMSIMYAVAPDYIMGRPDSEGGSGDPSPFTAEGVFQSIRATARRELGRGVEGLRVHLVGVGHVGSILAETLLTHGAKLFITETDLQRKERFDRPGVTFLPPGKYTQAEVFCPCAGGGVIGVDFPKTYGAIVGAANNQLMSDDDVSMTLAQKGIIYVPDWAANGGGLCSVAAEYLKKDRAWAWERTRQIGDRIDDLLRLARSENRTPLESAFSICDSRRTDLSV